MSNERRPRTDRDRPVVYRIRVRGTLRPEWAVWFDGMTVSTEENGDTVLTGLVADQAALHGLLRKVRDLCLPLLSLVRVEPCRSSSDDIASVIQRKDWE
jgi:hypothetical protein